MINPNRKLKTCLRCGQSWFARKAITKVCGVCRSPYWNIKRTRSYPKPIHRVPLDDLHERIRRMAMDIKK